MAVERPPGDHLLWLFDREDPRRAEEKYFRFRSKLIWYFDRHNCHCPEDLADETLYRIVRAISAGTDIYAQNPFAFFWAVAENVRKEEWKRHKSEPLEDHPPVSNEPFSSLENSIYLKECMEAALSPEERSLLRRFYVDGCQRTADRLGVTCAQLRLKLYRIRDKVRKFANSSRAKREGGR